MKSKRFITWMVSFFLLASGLTALVLHAHAGNDDIIEGVATVIDAGTLKNGVKVIKLHGVITPSARQKCKRASLPWLCGAAARLHLVKLAQEKTVQCLKIGAYHGQCFLEGTDLGENMVRNGWAVPDQSGAVYRDDEEIARAQKLGMWKYAK
jgi:endonuclease YncB( thermonuclease family)